MIFAVYLTITTSIDLFHTEDCVFGARHTNSPNCMSSNNSCPVCAFFAGHNSMGVSYGPTLFNAERLFVSRFLLHSEVIHCDEWACSIAPRAPPSTIIS